MPIKVKPCTQCWRSYDLPQFQALQLVSVDEDDGAQTRTCDQCDSDITIDVAALSHLDLRTPLEMLDDRMSARARPFKLLALAAFVLLAALVVATSLWVR